MSLVKQAYLQVERGPHRSLVTRARAVSPLALRTPHNHGHAAWVFTSSHGGGVVSGDHTALDVAVERDATLVLATQASTKAYRSRATAGTEVSRLETHVRVGDGGLACLLPDPFVPFAGARVEQTTRVALAAEGSVIVWDPITAGRVSRGEIWRSDHLVSQLSIEGPRGRLLTENVRLGPSESHPALATELHAFAVLVVLGPRVAPLARALLARAAQRPARVSGAVVVAHALARDGFEGAIARVACDDGATLGARLRDWLVDLPALLGDDVLARRAF